MERNASAGEKERFSHKLPAPQVFSLFKTPHFESTSTSTSTSRQNITTMAAKVAHEGVENLKSEF